VSLIEPIRPPSLPPILPRIVLRFLWLFLALVFAGTLCLRPQNLGVVLDQTFHAQVEGEGDVFEVTFPFRFSANGVDWRKQIHLSTEVEIVEEFENPALLIERPLFQVEAMWDGVDLESVQPIRADRFRGTHGLLLFLPKNHARAGPHQLELRIRGAHGEGGLLQQARVGEADQFVESLTRESTASIFVIAILLFAAGVNLLVAFSRPERDLPLSMGLFFLALALVVFCNVDAWHLRFQSDLWRLRMKSIAIVLAIGFSPMVLSNFSDLSFWVSRRIAVFSGIVAFSICLVPGFAYFQAIRSLVYVLSIIVAFMAVVFLGRSVVQGRKDAALFSALAVLMIVAGLTDVAAEYAQLGISPNLPFASGVFAVSLTVWVSLRSSDLADRYARLVARARDAIFVVDKNGAILDVNPSGAAVLREGDVTTLAECIDESSRSRFVEHLQSDGLGLPQEFSLVQGGEVRWVESVAVDLEFNQRMLVLRDITSRREVEEGLLSAAKMETVGIVARGLAHDFNNTLTALMAQVGLFRELKDAERTGKSLDQMEVTIAGASQMVRRLMTLVDGTEGSRHVQDFNQLVSSFSRFAEGLLPPDIRLVLHLSPDPLWIEVSAPEMEQVLLNLVLNARDAMKDQGGEIRIKTDQYTEEGVLILVVEDDGPGVEPKLREKIFQPFFSSKMDTVGTGIGLTLAARVVLEHGGKLNLREWEEGVGARFEVVFPIREPGRALESTIEKNLVAEKKERILIVEDNDDIREFISVFLKIRGFSCSMASCAEEARVCFSEGEFDLLVTDVVLGAEDGISLATEFCQIKPHLNVLVVSGYIPGHLNRIEDDWRSLSKPFTGDQIIAAVRASFLARTR